MQKISEERATCDLSAAAQGAPKFNRLFAAPVDALYASVIYIEAQALELQGSSSLSVNLEIRSVSTDSSKRKNRDSDG